MTKAGIDTVNFMPHSTRAASASAAFRKHIPLETITAATRWSAECTFATYCKKDVKEDTVHGESMPSCFDMGQGLLRMIFTIHALSHVISLRNNEEEEF